MTRTESIAFVSPPPGALARLAELAESWPAWFACNRQGEVWLARRELGSAPRKTRMVVRQTEPFLSDVLVPAILAFRPAGGRFVVSPDGVVLAATRTYAVVFGCLN